MSDPTGPSVRNPCPYCGHSLDDEPDAHSLCGRQAEHDWIGDGVMVRSLTSPIDVRESVLRLMHWIEVIVDDWQPSAARDRVEADVARVRAFLGTGDE